MLRRVIAIAVGRKAGMGVEPEQFGLFFAVLFVLRGFGITVGSHAAYDVLVGVLLSGN